MNYFLNFFINKGQDLLWFNQGDSVRGTEQHDKTRYLNKVSKIKQINRKNNKLALSKQFTLEHNKSAISKCIDLVQLFIIILKSEKMN